MGSEIQVVSGKATSNELENLHGKVAHIYNLALDSISEQYLGAIEEAEQLSESENEKYVKPKLRLSKEDIAVLKGAQSLLNDNDIQVDLSQSKGGKKLRGKINEIINR